MKRFVLFFLLLGIIFPMSLRAQVKVVNLTGDLIEINGTSIRFRDSKEMALPVINNSTTFEVVYYNDLVNKTGPIKITKNVDRGNRVFIKDFNSDSTPTVDSPASEEDFSNIPVVINDYPDNSTDWWSYVRVSPQNKLKNQSIFVPIAPFKGLALKPGQTSTKTADLKTGRIVFPVFLASNDSVATGGQFGWSLVNKIITEGQKVFEFLPEDIMRANSGDIVKKVIISKLPGAFIISNGKARGTVIAKDSPQRIELYVGWNIIPIQYKDQNGFPTEAILILLVDNKSRSLVARQKNKADVISVVPSNVIVTSLGR